MSKGQATLHVDETMDQVGARVIDAWHRMERGDAVDERHVSFADWDTLVRVLSPKRLEPLRHVHQHGAKNICVVALALGRDYRRVHEDVEALDAAGLVDRDKAGLRAEFEAFDVQMRVAL